MRHYLFPLGLLLSASLLFVIQPMVAKVLLPTYGGSPQVWTVCLLFFQSIVFLAYGYVWGLSRVSNPMVWRTLHGFIAIFSLIFFPFTFHPDTYFAKPELNILMTLLGALGLPLFVIASSAPLLQQAYSQTNRQRAHDPYFLYSASNIGSLAALLAYPYVVERLLGVHQQFLGWNIAYILYIIVLICILCFEQYSPHIRTPYQNTILKRTCCYWIFQSFVACGLMLSVTFYISTDIAATPLFWVIPLALYLLSFIFTFSQKPVVSHAWIMRIALIFILIPITGFLIGENQIPALPLILFNLIAFFGLSLMCHGELVRTRPKASNLALFYVCLALGGMIAGVFNGLIAPNLFSYDYEYAFFLLLASLCLTIPFNKYKQALLLSAVLLAIFTYVYWQKSLHVLNQQRNFYGVKQVKSLFGAHVLLSQNTLHGFQIPNSPYALGGARAYYASVLPVVQFFQKKPVINAEIIGLGTGILACQFRADDRLSMIEIDEQVIKIAKNPTLFTYLRDCPPQTNIIKKDGRLAISQALNHSNDLIILDAFQSDAIPVHLLTLEAFLLYQKKITTNGAILVNIANRHLNLLPVLTAVGRKLDLIVLHKKMPRNENLGQLASEWALLTTNESLAGHLLTNQGWRFVAEQNLRLWTNDYSNIVPLIKLNEAKVG